MPPASAWDALATNGPWAVAAGYLLWKVIEAWNGDRAQVTELLGDFKTAIQKLTDAVEHLTERMNRLDK